ncbi:hypothetical protein TNCV_2023511 [Trichonephila clavipes]|nr:hypothetical protein TNCV_2023511 [Trichonephila clavipes]
MRGVRYATDCPLSDGGSLRSLWQETSNLHLSLAVALSTMQVTRFGWVPLILRKNHGVSGSSHLSSPSTNVPRGLEARLLFCVFQCRKDTIHLQTSMPSPGLESRSNGTAVRVTNHYTRWVGFSTV